MGPMSLASGSGQANSKRERFMTYFPILPITFLIFMTLKLCEVITWSWWWVTAPLWGGFLFIIFVFFIFCVFAGVARALR